MNNSVFGKTTEHVKHRLDLRLTTDHKLAVKQCSMLNFKNAKYLNGFYMIEKYKTNVVMSKPIYVGCASLALSNLTMLQVQYNVIEQQFKNNYNLPYGDTDSFVYIIKHPDIYERIKKPSNILIYHIIHDDMRNDDSKTKTRML